MGHVSSSSEPRASAPERTEAWLRKNSLLTASFVKGGNTTQDRIQEKEGNQVRAWRLLPSPPALRLRSFGPLPPAPCPQSAHENPSGSVPRAPTCLDPNLGALVRPSCCFPWEKAKVRFS